MGKSFSPTPGLVVAEVAVFVIVIYAIGYFFNEKDPFFLQTPYSPTLLLSTVLALYYGFSGGFLFVVLLVVGSYLHYKRILFEPILWNVLFVLIASEFNYYWKRRIRLTEGENRYLSERLENLRGNFLLLKMLYDQIEFNYIARPYSLRDILKSLRRELLKDNNEKRMMEYVINLLAVNFQIFKAGIYKVKDKQSVLLAGVGNVEETLDLNDDLVKEALSTVQSCYLLPEFLYELGEYKYLSVIIVQGENESYVLAIQDMLFSNINQENFFYIKLIMQYLVEDLLLSKKIKVDSISVEHCDLDFVKEFYKLYNLKLKLGVPTTVLLFEADELDKASIYQIESSLRGLDMVCATKIEGKNIVFVLLPLTEKMNAKAVIERLTKISDGLKLVGIYYIDELSKNAKIRLLEEIK